jgi:hypothetical protein
VLTNESLHVGRIMFHLETKPSNLCLAMFQNGIIDAYLKWRGFSNDRQPEIFMAEISSHLLTAAASEVD